MGLADRFEINSRDNEPCESGRVARRAVKKTQKGAFWKIEAVGWRL
jgi:hypothetical protein